MIVLNIFPTLLRYYVSQAAFFPTPPAWHFSSKEEIVVPPTDPLIYSQIPFYMKGLTDTQAIVEMVNMQPRNITLIIDNIE
jgi:patched 1 protein